MAASAAPGVSVIGMDEGAQSDGVNAIPATTTGRTRAREAFEVSLRAVQDFGTDGVRLARTLILQGTCAIGRLLCAKPRVTMGASGI